jgi:predicted nucleic acid-binding protein
VSYLLDTNIISELRKGSRADRNVRAFFAEIDDDDVFLSVLVVGEIRRGIESLRRRDSASAKHLDRWLHRVLRAYGDRILPVDAGVAERWGALNVPDPLPVVDSLLAATALTHDLVLVTRNVSDFARTGVDTLNPFVPR